MRTPGLGDSRLSSTSGVLPIAATMSAYLPPHGRFSSSGSSIASESVVAGRSARGGEPAPVVAWTTQVGGRLDNRERERALYAIAGRQHGVLNVEHLRQIGFGRRGIEHRVADGRLQRVHRGVYALGHQPLSTEGQWLAAVLACGPGAVLSHADAGMLWGLIDNDESRSVNISVPAGSGRRSRPGISIHRCDLRRSDTTSRDGIPVTIVTRTLLDLAPSLPRRSLERALTRRSTARATPSVPGRCRSLQDAPEHALRKALERHEPGTTRTETDLEELMFNLCRRHGLPQPSCQVVILGFRVDFYWPEQKLIVETDGWESHNDRVSFERDRERDVELRAGGFPPPLRFTYRHLTGKPGWVASNLRQALGV